ncbi:primosomal protein DnaI [Neobacillus notoginsengisoli]|uniref:Primosomal protein DnaI n=1 Tax=Neobacillus notoginsengisoli TaxID=1578198 RepID=A0A417YU49_9BACI|nr:primosomal protein DnaI [Neobacillus notoginsengisoli]RHW40706.1 primosomal protein DnaI [Neobacillus notoginsengisoli]
MERINQTLKRLASNENFTKRYAQMKEEIMANRDVQDFITRNSNAVDAGMIERSLIKLYEYTNQSKHCQECESLEKCINIMQGYHPELVLQRNSIDVQYERCPRKVMADEKRKNEKLIRSLHVPRDILNASFGTLDIDGLPGRMEAMKRAASFVMNMDGDRKPKGLYLYGEFGVGKSYLLGAIANELAKKKISSMIVYVPELLREMKNSIADNSLNDKIDALKREPVLMLDDIGAEAMSSWTRDEVLGPILQFRMLENLPTFFSSNFDFQGLEHHLTYSQRGEEEKVKARRIMERIRYLSEPVKLDGPNRRN